MIEMFGDDAAIQAALRADHLLDQGDPAGCRLWKAIVEATKELQKDRPDPGHRLH
jgi:hypothetical protein